MSSFPTLKPVIGLSQRIFWKDFMAHSYDSAVVYCSPLLLVRKKLILSCHTLKRRHPWKCQHPWWQPLFYRASDYSLDAQSAPLAPQRWHQIPFFFIEFWADSLDAEITYLRKIFFRELSGHEVVSRLSVYGITHYDGKRVLVFLRMTLVKDERIGAISESCVLVGCV